VAQGDEMTKIEIIRVGAEAEAWNAVEAFRTFEGSRTKRVEEEKAAQAAEIEALATGFETTASGLRYQIIQKGTGAKAEKGKTVSVHYKGALPDGTVFDSSFKRNQPIDFQLGVGQVIPGWDEGISLLNVGDKARLVIPSDLGYGSAGAGGVIPPNATLVFDVELVAVK
jgi:peptidyl-prolyl cis-trans isomerase A (cyclophilin A)